MHIGILFTDRFTELKKPDDPIVKAPKSVQDTIEIIKITESGIFQVGKEKFSKTYKFQDINYVTTNEDEQTEILELYCKFLNSMDVNFKISIINKNRNMENMKRNVLFQSKNDEYDNLRDVYNKIIHEKIMEGTQGIEEERYLTVTVCRKNFHEAKVFFATIEANIKKSFDELGSEIISLNGVERLRTLHNFYRFGEEEEFSIDIEALKRRKADWKNDICNSKIQYFNTYFQTERKFGRALFLKKYPTALSDRFVNEITSLPVHSLTAIDVVPVPTEITTNTIQKKQLGIENDIVKQQRVRNKNMDFSSEVSYRKRAEKKEIEEMMSDVKDNDQSVFFVGVTIVVLADSKEELNSITETIVTIGKRHSCQIDTHYLKQRQAVNTVLPVGVRQVKTLRSMLTQSITTLLPFNVQELYEPSGQYYGINQISRNINLGNRKNLLNGNGFVFGVPGSGKSFFIKQELGGVHLTTEDDIIIIDPTHEYYDVARRYGGEVCTFSTYTKNYLNPLEIDFKQLDGVDSMGVIRDKGEFLIALCEQCMGSVNSKDKSIIDRCVRNLYMERLKTKETPKMSDFYDMLKQQPEEQAQGIALSLELFVEGSLNIFNNFTNVHTDNRFLVYGIRDLGKELSSLSMLVMLESINQRITRNAMLGRATWLYIDEFHVLLDMEYSAKYLYTLMKKVRKQGGLVTNITQNVIDLLQNYTAKTMLANSEFITLLKQAKTDSRELAKVINVSEAQLRFVNNSPSGTGLIKHGNTVIPFDNRIRKDSELYHLYNTNLHEKALMEQETKIA